MREFRFYSRELSSKFRAKVRMTIRGFLSEVSVEQRDRAISSNSRFETKVQRNFTIKSVGSLPTARNFALDRLNCLPCDIRDLRDLSFI